MIQENLQKIKTVVTENGFHRVGQLVIELSHEFVYRSYFHKDGRKPVGEIVCKQSSFKVSADLLSITNLPT